MLPWDNKKKKNCKPDTNQRFLEMASPAEKCMILFGMQISNSELKSSNPCMINRKHYVCCMYCCSSSHANVLVRNQLKVHVLQKYCESNNSFHQSKLITNTRPGSTTEWNESVAIYFTLLVFSAKWDMKKVKNSCLGAIQCIFRKIGSGNIKCQET